MDYLVAVTTAFATLTLALYAIIQTRIVRQQVRLIREELRESKKARDANIIVYIVQHMHSFRQKWHILYKLPNDHKSWTEEQKELADDVCVNLQTVAFFATTGLVERGYIIDTFGAVFVRCWRKLKGFVGNYRQACNEPRNLKEGALQRKHLEQFVSECEQYLREKHPGVYRSIIESDDQ